MKTIKLNEINKKGIFINLEEQYTDYEKLLYNPEKYLNKNNLYYFYCKNGIKSKKVVSILELYGYNVIRVVK